MEDCVVSELLHGQQKIASHAQFACLSFVVNAVKHGNWMWDGNMHRQTQTHTGTDKESNTIPYNSTLH